MSTLTRARRDDEPTSSIASALYGAGFVSRRHVTGVRYSAARLDAPGDPPLEDYRAELRYLARASEWAGQWHSFHFGPVVETWSAIEPEAHLFPQDRLRASPLLFYTGVIDSLVLDANRLAGIEHDLFGRRVGSGLRALNPGLTRGGLVAPEKPEPPEGGFSRDGIYLLPESTAELPRVNGILTRGEGSSLSHVQLLARNLGIPNVVVGNEHVPTVQKHDGRDVVLAVTNQRLLVFTLHRVKGVPKELLAEFPIGDVADVVAEPKKLMTRLTVAFGDGSMADFDAQKMAKPGDFVAGFARATGRG